MTLYEILKKHNYYIQYNYLRSSSDNHSWAAVITISLENNETVAFKYILKDKILYITMAGETREVKCSPRTAPLIVKYYLYEICARHDYPVRNAIITLDNNITNKKFAFGNSEKDDPDFVYLLWDVYETGLRRDQIDIAKDEGFWPELKTFLQEIYDIGITDDQEKT